MNLKRSKTYVSFTIKGSDPVIQLLRDTHSTVPSTTVSPHRAALDLQRPCDLVMILPQLSYCLLYQNKQSLSPFLQGWQQLQLLTPCRVGKVCFVLVCTTDATNLQTDLINTTQTVELLILLITNVITFVSHYYMLLLFFYIVLKMWLSLYISYCVCIYCMNLSTTENKGSSLICVF